MAPNRGRDHASSRNPDRPVGDHRIAGSELRSTGGEREDTAPGLGTLRQGTLGLADMATVQTGDPHLDLLAHAVAIDRLLDDA